MTEHLLVLYVLAVPTWCNVWHSRRQVVDAPIASRHCYMGNVKSTYGVILVDMAYVTSFESGRA